MFLHPLEMIGVVMFWGGCFVLFFKAQDDLIIH